MLPAGFTKFSWHPFARGPGQRTGVELTPQFYGIVKGTQHPQEAWEWLKFLTNEAIWAGRIPAFQPAAIAFFQEMAREHPSVMYLLDALTDPTSYPRPLWQPAIDELNPWLTRAIIDQEISLEEALIQADQAIRAALQR